MRIQGFGRTHVGQVRQANEDFLLVDPDLGLYIVCDGCGGHAGGSIASRTAALAVERSLQAGRSVIDAFQDTPASRAGVVRLVEDAIQDASREIFKLASGDTKNAGMATTLTLLLTLGDKGLMGHVGDSRLYLFRDGQIHRLSEDHTYVNELIRRGKATPEEAAASPYGHVIMRALGPESTQVDTLLFDILPGDVFLLCSDGLIRHVEDEEMPAILADPRTEMLPQQLVELANARGAEDNVTTIVVRVEVEQDEEALAQRRTIDVHAQLHALKEASLFRHLDLRELCAVLSVATVATAEPGEIVVREGGPGERLYLVTDGELAVSRGGQELARVTRGSHFGEMALVSQRPRSATVTATTPARFLVLDRERFERLIRNDPRLGIKLLWSFVEVLSTRLDETSLLSAR